jgi:serine/threonine protein kinase
LLSLDSRGRISVWPRILNIQQQIRGKTEKERKSSMRGRWELITHFTVFLLISCGVRGFTEPFRILNTAERRSNVTLEKEWDAVLDWNMESIDPAAQVLLKDSLNDYLQDKLTTYYHHYLSSAYRKEKYFWLSFTNPSLQDLAYDHYLETESLKTGKILARESCNSQLRTRSPQSCYYFDEVMKYNIIYSDLKPSNLLANPIENLFGIIRLVENLFNRGWYDHAKALSFHSIFHIIPDFHQKFSSDPVMGREITDAIIRISLVLKEIESVQGNLEASTIWSLYHLKNVYDRFNNSNDPMIVKQKLALFQLRVLIGIPVIPRTTEESSMNRQLMLRSLDLFADDVKRNKVTITIDDLTGEVSGTPFHMSHQGLNDLDFQLAFNNVLFALVPDLLFHHSLLSPIPTVTLAAPSVQQLEERKSVKVGFISSHLYDHSIGRMLLQLILLIDEGPMFELKNTGEVIDPVIYVYSLEPSKRNDEITKMFELGLKSNFIRLPANTERARNEILKDSLDILVYADLGMDLLSYTIAFSRLATFQVLFLVVSSFSCVHYSLLLNHRLLGGDIQSPVDCLRLTIISA